MDKEKLGCISCSFCNHRDYYLEKLPCAYPGTIAEYIADEFQCIKHRPKENPDEVKKRKTEIETRERREEYWNTLMK